LADVVGEVLELMAHELSLKGIEVRNEVSQTALISVQAESGPLHQVLLNLLINSMHAIETAKKAGKAGPHFVKIGVVEESADWVMQVEDTGCGISKENMKKLFQPFFTTKELGVGTGLGLATSYRILESWGGAISARSNEGRGAQFEVRLKKAPTTSLQAGA
jgi:C4-dicarboxylate-specific signal transduction histidine kinase